jgi:hypothetical protein
MGAKRFYKNINESPQKELKTIKDIENVLTLDEAHWATTGVSNNALNCDNTFIDYVDIDNNKRVMCFEVTNSIKWLFKILKDRQSILDTSDILKLESINTDEKEGKAIHDSVKQILKKLRNSKEQQVSLKQVRKIKEDVSKTAISEAGVVLKEASEDDKIKELISSVIKTLGGVPHPSGKEGINKEKFDEFTKTAKVYLKWHEKSVISSGEKETEIMPLGLNTLKAYKSFIKIHEKIDHFFSLCKVLSFTKRAKKITDNIAKTAEGKTQETSAPLNINSKEVIENYLKESPLANPNLEQELVFSEIINFYYEDAVKNFIEDVIKPFKITPADRLSYRQWITIREKMAGHRKWQNSKQGAKVESIAVDKLREFTEEEFISKVHKLIEESIDTALVLDEIRNVEKLILFQIWMMKFLNNFVYFPYLYDPQKRALFEMGTLVMDGRRFTLSVQVDNHEKHMQFSKQSNMFILYVNVLSSTEKKYEVAVPVTSGGKGNLYIGKRGIFQDTNKTDWDAEIIGIVENPISLKEAFSTPFKKLGKLINAKIEELKSAAETQLDTVVKGSETPPVQTQQTDNKGIGNLFMGGGIAIAAIGSAMAFITKTLSEVEWHTILFTILGAVSAVLLPTFISAFIKLKKRDLSAILEASGWAVNARMKLTFKLGKFFTQRPKIKKPFSIKKLISLFISLVILALLSYGIILLFSMITLSTSLPY